MARIRDRITIRQKDSNGYGFYSRLHEPVNDALIEDGDAPLIHPLSA